MNKDPLIIEVVAKLRSRLGDAAFQIVDHWEDSLT